MNSLIFIAALYNQFLMPRPLLWIQSMATVVEAFKHFIKWFFIKISLCFIMGYADTLTCNWSITSFRTAAMHFSNLLTTLKSQQETVKDTFDHT